MNLGQLTSTKYTVFPLLCYLCCVIHTAFGHAVGPLLDTWLIKTTAINRCIKYILVFTQELEKLLLSSLLYNLLQILWKLLSYQQCSFNIVLINEILFAEQLLIRSWHILMQDIDFGKVVRVYYLWGDTFGLGWDNPFYNWLVLCQDFIQACFSIAAFCHCSGHEQIIDGEDTHHTEHYLLALEIEGG